MMRFVISASLRLKGGMHRSDDEIELRQNFILEIERAVPQNVAFDSGEEPELSEVVH